MSLGHGGGFRLANFGTFYEPATQCDNLFYRACLAQKTWRRGGQRVVLCGA